MAGRTRRFLLIKQLGRSGQPHTLHVKSEVFQNAQLECLEAGIVPDGSEGLAERAFPKFRELEKVNLEEF